MCQACEQAYEQNLTPQHFGIPENYFRTALGNTGQHVDISALERIERIERSRDVNLFLDPAAPGLVYQLLEDHAKRSSNGVFNDQYGQICLRILIRLVQVLICDMAHTLELIGSQMMSPSTDTEISTYLAKHTLGVVIGQPDSTASVGILKADCLIRYPQSELFNNERTRGMLSMLWEDRKVIFVLYKNGLLKGFLLLLYAIWAYASKSLLVSRENPEMILLLRDLFLRIYLVTFTEERDYIRFLYLGPIYQTYQGHNKKSIPVDIEDSRAVIHAYYQCIMRPADPDPDGETKLHMFRLLLEFVSDLTDPMMHEEPPLVARAAIERLWQAYDTEKTGRLLPPPTTKMVESRFYMKDIQYVLGLLLQNFPPGRAVQPLIEALVQSDWSNLMAKHILHCFRTMDIVTDLPAFQMDPSPASRQLESPRFKNPTEEMFAGTFSDWLKVANHLWTLHGSYEPGHPNIHPVRCHMELWHVWGKVMGFVERFSQTDCTYPRCPGGLSTHVCGTCGFARYCSVRCQRADWLSPFLDSHKRTCQAKNGART
ncbi:hypothetical protein FRC12_006926 [Ceratobasidium sp. 428]|nr:hypothetical protein FRC12_006926 [Ceratobasidium sp. 428]